MCDSLEDHHRKAQKRIGKKELNINLKQESEFVKQIP